MAQDFPYPTGSFAAHPLTRSTHITCQQWTDAELGAFAIFASNGVDVLFLTSTDGRVQHLTSTHSRLTDGVVRVGGRCAIHEWRSRARVRVERRRSLMSDYESRRGGTASKSS